jgi:oxygen-dependent protoporphyrinogen oxidase
MRIGIVGAGISGLALGWQLLQQKVPNLSLSLFEKNARPGGWIQTLVKDQFLFEKGPRSFRSRGRGEATLSLIESLDLQQEVIPAALSARARYLYCQGALHQLPSTPVSFLLSPLMKGVIPACLCEWFKAPSSLEDESIYSFISRRFSPQIADRLIDPMISGIFAGDIQQLSVKSCLPFLHQYEQEEGSVIKGLLKKVFKRKTSQDSKSVWIQEMQKEPLLTFRRGMGTLVEALASKLQPHLHYGKAATSVRLTTAGVELVCNGTETTLLDRLILALPSSAAAPLLTPYISMPPLRAESIAAVNLGWNETVWDKEGFGYLIPTSEKEELLGVVWDSSAFSLQNLCPGQTRLTAMLGGAHHKEIVHLPEEKLIEIVLRSIEKQMGIRKRPDAIHCSIAHEAIPQYFVGHASRVKAFEESLSAWSNERISVIGNSWHGAGINDCIFEARRYL